MAVVAPVSRSGSIKSRLSYSGYRRSCCWALGVAPGFGPRVAGGDWVVHCVQGAVGKGGREVGLQEGGEQGVQEGLPGEVCLMSFWGIQARLTVRVQVTARPPDLGGKRALHLSLP